MSLDADAAKRKATTTSCSRRSTSSQGSFETLNRRLDEDGIIKLEASS
jgi:hypothetical protein